MAVLTQWSPRVHFFLSLFYSHLTPCPMAPVIMSHKFFYQFSCTSLSSLSTHTSSKVIDLSMTGWHFLMGVFPTWPSVRTKHRCFSALHGNNVTPIHLSAKILAVNFDNHFILWCSHSSHWLTVWVSHWLCGITSSVHQIRPCLPKVSSQFLVQDLFISGLDCYNFLLAGLSGSAFKHCHFINKA